MIFGCIIWAGGCLNRSLSNLVSVLLLVFLVLVTNDEGLGNYYV